MLDAVDLDEMACEQGTQNARATRDQDGTLRAKPATRRYLASRGLAGWYLAGRGRGRGRGSREAGCQDVALPDGKLGFIARERPSQCGARGVLVVQVEEH